MNDSNIEYIAKIGSVKYSLDSDIYDFHIDAWFRKNCIDVIDWYDTHYPNQVEYLFTNTNNINYYYKYIIWYAKFQTKEAYTHFILSNNPKDNENL